MGEVNVRQEANFLTSLSPQKMRQGIKERWKAREQKQKQGKGPH
jgi:hypothetical protein